MMMRAFFDGFVSSFMSDFYVCNHIDSAATDSQDNSRFNDSSCYSLRCTHACEMGRIA